MKTIAVPLLRTENSIGAVGPIEILTKTCVLWRQLNEGAPGGPLFDLQIVAEKRKPVAFANGIPLNRSASLDEVKPDLILVPSIDEELDSALKRNQSYVEWVKESFKRGAHLSSLCTGAFVLALQARWMEDERPRIGFSRTSSGGGFQRLTSRNAIWLSTRAMSSPAVVQPRSSI